MRGAPRRGTEVFGAWGFIAKWSEEWWVSLILYKNRPALGVIFGWVWRT
jgi:hypothetical protein